MDGEIQQEEQRRDDTVKVEKKDSPFLFSAIVIIGCLMLSVGLVVLVKGVPAVLVAVILSFAASTLVYTVLGGITEAGFNLGPLKVTGSAAVLLGGAWWINQELEPQLRSFNFAAFAAPADDWFAIHETTAAPVEIKFTDPVTEEIVETVKPPRTPSLPLKMVPNKESNDRYLVMGAEADPKSGLGYITSGNLISVVGTFGLQPGTVYGLQRLHLGLESRLPDGMVRRWGNTVCRGERSMPFEIEVTRFYQVSESDSRGVAEYNLRRCNAEGASPDHSSSLAQGDGELVALTINGKHRSFLIAVVAANHQSNQDEPPWSTFFATEIVSGR